MDQREKEIGQLADEIRQQIIDEGGLIGKKLANLEVGDLITLFELVATAALKVANQHG